MKTDPTALKLWTTQQVVFATLFVVCVFLSFWLLYRFRVVVFLFFISMVIGISIRPAVEWLYRRGLSRPAGIIAIYLVIAGLLVGFLSLVVPLIVNQATQLSQNLPQYQQDLQKALLNSHNLILQNIAIRIPAWPTLFQKNNPSTEEVFDQVNQTFHYTGMFMRGVLNILAVFLLAYYWTQESNFVIRNLLRLIPRSRRRDVREFIQTVESKIGGYVRGEGILCMAVGSAAFIAYLLIGLPYTLVLGIIAGLMEMIPIFGPILGAVPALLVALSVGPDKAIWVIVATAMIQFMENVFLVPHIMNHSMGVNPIITLLSLLTFGSVFGFPGALLALPLAAVLQLALKRIVYSRSDYAPSLQAGEIDLQSLLATSRETATVIMECSLGDHSTFCNAPELVCQEIISVARELNTLLEKMERDEEQ
jgi:predicted PurR-regulated permease PerM